MARQDTIDEGGEGDTPARIAERHTSERQPTERDRLLEASGTSKVAHMDRNLSLERERQIEMATSRATTSDTYDTGLREQPPTMAQRDLLATVLDLKVDVRLEMQRLQQRIGRMEDLLTELIKRLAQDSSGVSTPGDDSAPTVVPVTPTSLTAVPQLSLPSSMLMTTAAGTSTSTTGAAPLTLMTPPTPPAAMLPGTSSGGNGLGPILLRKRRSKSRKAPAPPKQSPEQTRLLEAEPPSTSTTRKREFL